MLLVSVPFGTLVGWVADDLVNAGSDGEPCSERQRQAFERGEGAVGGDTIVQAARASICWELRQASGKTPQASDRATRSLPLGIEG